MDQWYPHAQRRPLGPQRQHPIKPRIFIVHTMVGHLGGTDRMFRAAGYVGLESHFGLGGPRDPGLDGVLYQWQSLGYSADAQAAGNAYATSIETADGGDPDNPWSAKQLSTLVNLGAWWAHQVGAPGRLVTSPGGTGFGYHRQFSVWNKNGHTCPGDVRLRQYTHDVLPRIAARMHASPAHRAGNGTDKKRVTIRRALRLGDNGADVRLVQHLVNVRLDNDFGPRTESGVKTWQRRKKLADDGVFGPVCCRAAGWTWEG